MFEIVELKTTIVTEEEMLQEVNQFKEENKDALKGNIVDRVKSLLKK